ncbi:MAG: type II toxin-antitoxin system YhaV family toxin [Candidatus Omnitrophica bacterium]|nr:type II toxin-antitoxin system YhaV family toxin [Candidatus Omnitrophota bacterium]MBU1127616.1 type II toxin-antitoxin system YhaV family toxin [Candidatus Omnitrophota bacterium]MBU1783903.1 type II toxin-antitoxin system YhaV family toxin [Candidatus Omnitrophota bacterium]MBU1851441.1 type II toxin-antitoxin system YhaV family toxin [Candidatus Omnitrophota bacterium]
MMNNYLLRYHDFYYHRIVRLKQRVIELRKKLNDKEYAQHEIVKFAARIRKADQEIIPENPDRPEYRLHGDLKRYRRYKQGLQRYRMFFCFSNQPKIIVYLYLNDEKHLRKSGDKNDAYKEFKKLVVKKHFSHNPEDPKIQKWITNYRP